MRERGRRARSLLIVANDEFNHQRHAIPAFRPLAKRPVDQPGREHDERIIRSQGRDGFVDLLRREDGARADNHRAFLGVANAFVSWPRGKSRARQVGLTGRVPSRRLQRKKTAEIGVFKTAA